MLHDAEKIYMYKYNDILDHYMRHYVEKCEVFACAASSFSSRAARKGCKDTEEKRGRVPPLLWALTQPGAPRTRGVPHTPLASLFLCRAISPPLHPSLTLNLHCFFSRHTNG